MYQIIHRHYYHPAIKRGKFIIGPNIKFLKSIILSNLRPTKIAGEEFNDLTSDFFSQFQIQPKGAPQCLQYAIFQEYPEKKDVTL